MLTETRTVDQFKDWAEDRMEIKAHEIVQNNPVLCAFGDNKASNPSVISNRNLYLNQDESVSKVWAKANTDKQPMPSGWDSDIANGIQVVTNIALSKSKWNPAKPDDADNAPLFLDYVQRVATCPFLKLIQSDSVNLKFSESWNDFFKHMERECTAMGIPETANMKEQLKILAESAASFEKNTVTWTSMSMGVIDSSADKADFYIVYSTVGFYQETHGSGKSEVTDRTETMKMTRVKVEMDKSTFKDHAELLWNYQYDDWNSWSTDATSPAKDNKPKHFCW